MNEATLRAELVAGLDQFFDFEEEVPGKHVNTGEPVRADLIAYPRPSLVSVGFLDRPFPVETKVIDWDRVESGRLYKAFWQAHTYSESVFNSPRFGEIQPLYAALYVTARPFPLPEDHRQIQSRRWDILLELGVYANVGHFRFRDTEDWGLYFGQGSYFHARRGISALPRGLNARVGSRGIKYEK